MALRNAVKGASGFQRTECAFCRRYAAHTTSTCPSDEARAWRREKAARRRASRRYSALATSMDLLAYGLRMGAR